LLLLLKCMSPKKKFSIRKLCEHGKFHLHRTTIAVSLDIHSIYSHPRFLPQHYNKPFYTIYWTIAQMTRPLYVSSRGHGWGTIQPIKFTSVMKEALFAAAFLSLVLQHYGKHTCMCTCHVRSCQR
jgi:hypothetical protein